MLHASLVPIIAMEEFRPGHPIYLLDQGILGSLKFLWALKVFLIDDDDMILNPSASPLLIFISDILLNEACNMQELRY